MSFPRYESYKDSGMEWLGSVPNHWELRRLGYYFDERREKVSDADYAALSVTKNGIVPQLETAAKTDDGDNRKRVAVGDFVINSRSDRKGSSGLSHLEGSVALINTVLAPRPDVHPRYVHHCLRSTQFQEEYYRFGRGIVADLWSTNYSEMRNILLAVPPYPEQIAIAEFLDHETAKIDDLVEEQQRLIELLKEKRQAVISHAVTKGLNPNAPMKDSGVEWLGEVPAHWNVGPLKRYWSITDCKHITAEFVEDGIPLASIREVQGWTVDLDEAKCTTDYYYEQLIEGDRDPRPGDIIFTRNATVGEAAMVPDSGPVFAMGQDVCLLRRREPMAAPAFMLYQLKCSVVGTQLKSIMIGSTFKRVNVEEIRGLVVTMPPSAEQHHIGDYLEAETRQFDTLIAKAESAIGLLLERRTALISAAVTGKIDVRSKVPYPEPAPA